jgi:hypothetical protein
MAFSRPAATADKPLRDGRIDIVFPIMTAGGHPEQPTGQR